MASLSLVLIPVKQNRGENDHAEDMVVSIVGASYMAGQGVGGRVVPVVGVTAAAAVELLDLGLEAGRVGALALAQPRAPAVEDEGGHRADVLHRGGDRALVHVDLQEHRLGILERQLLEDRGDSLAGSAPA